VRGLQCVLLGRVRDDIGDEIDDSNGFRIKVLCRARLGNGKISVLSLAMCKQSRNITTAMECMETEPEAVVKVRLRGILTRLGRAL
jgi:hypothetical protein